MCAWCRFEVWGRCSILRSPARRRIPFSLFAGTSTIKDEPESPSISLFVTSYRIHSTSNYSTCPQQLNISYQCGNTTHTHCALYIYIIKKKHAFLSVRLSVNILYFRIFLEKYYHLYNKEKTCFFVRPSVNILLFLLFLEK